MSRPWDSDMEITADAARSIIRDQFPALRASAVRLLGNGWDNTAFLVDDRIVFRFPRKISAVALLETEARVLPVLHARLPVAVPVPEWIGSPCNAFPWLFTGYRLIPGETGCRARLSHGERVRNAPLLASFLSSLHAMAPARLRLPPDLLDRRNFAARMPLIVERLETLRASGVVAEQDPWLRLFLALENAPPTCNDVIVHGDLYARHLLVDSDRRLSGVIDWGDVHAGDIAMDLMLLYGFLPAAARVPFLDAYGPVGEDVLRIARLRAAFHAVSVAWYGAEMGDADLLHEGRFALDCVLDD